MNIINKPIKYAFILSSILSASSLCAAAVTYDESISGDVNPNNPFLLAEGQNYITGTVSMGAAYDGDGFYFTIPKNFKANISLSGAIDLGGSPFGASFTWTLKRGVTTGDCSIACLTLYEPVAYQVFSSGDNVGYILPSGGENLPSMPSIHELGSGSYFLFNSGGAGSLVLTGEEPWSNYLYSLNYTAAFDLQPVPLPSAIYFFAASLMGLSSLTRRKVARG